MPDQPSQQEIAFAQERGRLQSALLPYFQDKAQAAGKQMLEFSGKILTKDGGRPLEHTIEGQTLSYTAKFEGDEEITLLIGHTAEWKAVVRIHNTRGGIEPTVFVLKDVETSIIEIQGLIDNAFRRVGGL